MPIWLIILLVVAFVFATISVVLYFIQDNMIFHPEKLPADYQFSFNNEFEEFNLQTDDGVTLNALLFKAKNSKGALIFYHNHSGNIKIWSRSAFFAMNLNLDVLLMDYRGFGKSTGTFQEALMQKDALLWYDLMKKLYPEDAILVAGRGMGAFFASYVSAKNKPSKLLLESPIYSVLHTAKAHYPYLPLKWILKYKFETYRYITEVQCKTYIFHGLKDDLVPYSNSVKLHEMSEKVSDLTLVPEGTHYNLLSQQVYLDKIDEIVRT